jgi:GH24 family phage-related lysozyme (muramidase)
MDKLQDAPTDGDSYCGISQDAFDLIVGFEVSSRAVYEKKYTRPIRPGGASGITIGIGYDCGYATVAQIATDWGRLLPAAMVKALQGVAGLTGMNAQAALAKVRTRVEVPWEAALIVFARTSLPKYAALTARLPNYERLHPHCKGALVSLVYNRGASFSTAGARYQEMRAIKAHMAAERFAAIPAEFRVMKRLWAGDSSLKGLLTRRDKEADLFEFGLLAAPDEPLVADHKPPDPDPQRLLTSTDDPQPQPPSRVASFLAAIAALFRRA